MQNYRDAERIINQWTERSLTPPECCSEEVQECCMCPNEAEYEVDGDYYCEECLLETFRI